MSTEKEVGQGCLSLGAHDNGDCALERASRTDIIQKWRLVGEGLTDHFEFLKKGLKLGGGDHEDGSVAYIFTSGCESLSKANPFDW